MESIVLKAFITPKSLCNRSKYCLYVQYFDRFFNFDKCVLQPCLRPQTASAQRYLFKLCGYVALQTRLTQQAWKRTYLPQSSRQSIFAVAGFTMRVFNNLSGCLLLLGHYILSKLQPYPFERLHQLHAGVTPNPTYEPISFGSGQPAAT